MKNKYTAEDMLHDLNEMKEFRFYMFQRENRSEREKGYDKGFTDACVWAMSLFKGYLAENK